MVAFPVEAQTYKIQGNGSAKQEAKPSQTNSSGQSLGFGSNIQNARLARAAELALKQGNHALALSYAQRAAHAAPNDPQLWFLVGYAARLNGNYALAVEAYNRGLHLRPSSPEGISGLAQTYAVMGRTSDAEQLLKQVLSSNPKRRNDALVLGNLFMKSGDYTSALDWLNKAEQMQSGARSELLLALAYRHQYRPDLANRYLQMANRRAPNNPEVRRSLAGYYRSIGNYPVAIATLRSIQNPKPDVIAELAYTYQLAGDSNQSAKFYAKAADARPKDIGLQLSAAQAEIGAGSIESANAFLQRAEAIDSNYYRLHAIRGEIAQLQERNSEAVREYSVALAQLPRNPAEGPLYGIQLHVDLMELYRKLDDQSSAQQQLVLAQQEIGQLDERGPERASFLRLRALIKMNAGQLDSALSDMKEALALIPHDPNNLQLDGDLLMKMGRTEEAIAVYRRVLAIDPKNRFALTSLGYASRTAGRDGDARRYFEQLARDYPTLAIPYLALGDMYTAHKQFGKAEASYRKAYSLSPNNVLIVAGGMNAGIEAHKLDATAAWYRRVTDKMRNDPQILKETERYLRLSGQYRESADVGRKAIEALPQDRDVVVYLGYDLLQLGKYDELAQLTAKYSSVFPKEPDIPLLDGYVQKHNGNLQLALRDFTEALRRDPDVATAYVNRGYVLNDLHNPTDASKDFEAALKRDPTNGTAHLGLAYADLALNRSHAAIRQSELAEKSMGDSEMIHMIRATAYGREGVLTKAADEYRAALKFAPNDGTLHLDLGNTLFSERNYHAAIDELNTAQKFSPDNPRAYALLARSYAYLQDNRQTLHYVQLAEQHAQQAPAAEAGSQFNASDIYVATGQALSTLGDEKAAMERFRRALTMPKSDRVGVRLAIAQVMAQQDRPEDAQRQIALAQMEAEAGATQPVTGSQYVEAADVLRQIHEYQLSQTYLEHAKTAGAPDISVRVGMANNYLAVGDTTRAAAELAAVKQTEDNAANYQYLLAEANVYQQEHHGTQALTAFAQAANAAGEDETANQELLQTAGNEGYRINSRLSMLGNFTMQPIYEPTTVYVLDAKLDGPAPIPPSDVALLPPPRSSLYTQGMAAYHLHWGDIPMGGFFQVSNARGKISVPATSSIVNRSTTDYSANFGVAPTVHLGRNALTFDSGIQGTIRRDSKSPRQLNQNIFRAFTYLSTSSFFDVLSMNGYAIWETGPFTEINLHSKALASAVNFRVGAPWGKTALVTGWGLNDQQFSPTGTEDYYTSSYIGLTRRFSRKLNIEGLVEDLRTWRVFNGRSGIAQALRPAGSVDFTPNRRWEVQASFSYSSTRNFHVYDAIQDGISVSYERGFHRTLNEKTGTVRVEYPIRFSAGFQHEDFFNFTKGSNQQFRPYVSITLF